MLTYMMFILIPIVAIMVYISISGQFVSECKPQISGTRLSVLGSLKNCVDLCWSKHDFGQDIFSDDCFMVTVYPNSTIAKGDMEIFFGLNTNIYFDSFEPDTVYKIKVRYNSTGKEISLILFEKIVQSV